MERATGIEPASVAWEAAVLPLNYARFRAIFQSRDEIIDKPHPKDNTRPNFSEFVIPKAHPQGLIRSQACA